MTSEWIRPAGCESGSCVEYRTVDGKVFVRNGGTENLSDDGNILQFSVAEWDTFVAGLVGEMRPRLAAYERALLTAGQDLDRYKGWLAAANEELNEAIAEREVLRHRDRFEDKLAAVIERMLPVVQGAVAWRRMFNRLVLSRRESLALWDAVDAYEKGPTEPLAAPMLAERLGPLTEVLPEPAAPTAADLQAARDQTRADATAMLGDSVAKRFTASRAGWYEITRYLTAVREGASGLPDLADVERVVVHLTDEDLADNDREPDDEGPEAGRAGEAQEWREGPCDGVGCECEPCDPPSQDRTEGLDAAIEAAKVSAIGDIPWLRIGRVATPDAINEWLADKIRAASPLIERGADLVAGRLGGRTQRAAPGYSGWWWGVSTDAMIRARRRWACLAGGAFVWHVASSLLLRVPWEPVAEPGWGGVAICVGYAAYYHGRINQQEVPDDPS